MTQPPQKRRLSPARLLSGDLGQTTPPKRSKKAERMKVASTGEGMAVTRTNIAEVWVPLKNAGSEARVLIELQGAPPHRASLCSVAGLCIRTLHLADFASANAMRARCGSCLMAHRLQVLSATRIRRSSQRYSRLRT